MPLPSPIETWSPRLRAAAVCPRYRPHLPTTVWSNLYVNDSVPHDDTTTQHPGTLAEADDLTRTAAARFGAVVATIGDSIRDDDHLLELLDRLIAAACENIRDVDHASVTIDIDARTFTACSTDESTLVIDTEQYDLESGPSLTAARTPGTVVADCDVLDQRWPDFGPTARAAGVHSILAEPITSTDTTFGTVNLYSRTARAFDDIDRSLLTALTTAIGAAVGDFARYSTARDTADGLRTAMDNRAPIEQAKGILMALHRIGPDQAFTILSTQSQHANRRLREIAAEFVADVSSAAASMTDSRR